MINEVVDGINKILKELPGKFDRLSEEAVSRHPSPGKWSKKQILGHLCDSALNNYSRFIRVQIEPEPFDIRRYRQDEWVEFNHYQDISSKEIIELWDVLNRRIVHIISEIPDDKLKIICDTGDGEIHTLEFIIRDYLAHMNHHLEQI